MPETITVDGRGLTIQEAIREMWARMQPLEERGFHPISGVEVVDARKREVVETFLLTDSEFLAHLKSDQDAKPLERLEDRPHAPERKEHYPYLARITLEA